jgi:hypothetical protein
MGGAAHAHCCSSPVAGFPVKEAGFPVLILISIDDNYTNNVSYICAKVHP